MTWRVAKSLDVLLAEINETAPGRSKASDGSIGDTAHQSGASDHNPNAAGVVTARDFTHDPVHGADMVAISRTIVTTRPPALKYVIFNRRIWQDGSWQAYYGDDPHTGHMHVSVGRGPDGRSTGPYDDTMPWGVAEEDDVSAKDVWTYDPGSPDDDGGVANIPGRTDSDINPTVQPAFALSRAWAESRDSAAGTRAIQAEQVQAKARDLAILQAVKGVDTAAILAHIDALAAADKTRDEALLAEIKGLASGGATADQIVDALAARLAN